MDKRNGSINPFMLFKNSLHGSNCPSSDGDCLRSFSIVSVSNKHHRSSSWRIGCPVILAWWRDDEKKIGVWITSELEVLLSQHSKVGSSARRRQMGTWHRTLIHPWGLRLYKSPTEKERSSSWTLFSHHWGDQQLSGVYYWIRNLENKLGAFIFKFCRCFGRQNYCHVVSITLVIHSFWERWWGSVGRLHRSRVGSVRKKKSSPS